MTFFPKTIVAEKQEKSYDQLHIVEPTYYTNSGYNL